MQGYSHTEVPVKIKALCNKLTVKKLVEALKIVLDISIFTVLHSLVAEWDLTVLSTTQDIK